MMQRQWNITDPRELFRIAKGEEVLGAALYIIRIAPGDGHIKVDWQHLLQAGDSTQFEYSIEVKSLNGESEVQKLPIGQFAGNVSQTTVIPDLTNGADYEIRLSAIAVDIKKTTVVSPARLARPGIIPGTVINYMHPDDMTYDFSGRSTASPSIARLPDGRLIASHDIYWKEAGQNVSKIFRSDDDGKTWYFVTNLYPCFWGKLFIHRDCVYMLATSTEYGALLIGRSDDGGSTWTPPTVLLEAGSREAGGPHKAPMPVIVHHGRVWTSIDYGSWTTGGHKTGVISAPVEADLLDSASWTVTPFLPYDPEWLGGEIVKRVPGLLEGNTVVTPDGRLVVVPRYQAGYGKGIILHVDQEHPAAPLSLGKLIDFHGNLSKFTIYYDERSGLYLSLVNKVTGIYPAQRNILTLVSSPDLEQWRLVKDILDYEHNGWPEDMKLVGFQYIDWMFDEDDILFVSRTALNGAHNFHDANHLTFHRIERFRELL